MWIQSFIDYLRYERNYSERTIEAYQADLEEFRQFFETLNSELTWETIDKDVIRDWVMEMMNRGNIASSVNRRLSAVRSFYKFLLRRGMIDHDPAHSLKGPKQEKPLPTYLRESEMDRLFDDMTFPSTYAGVRDRMILLMFYSTGIRVSELVGLHVNDVELGAFQLKVTGKRNKQRLIPFGNELAEAVRDYLGERQEFCRAKGTNGTTLFLDERNGSPMKTEKVRARVQHYLSLVTTQKKKSPHVLRHTFATTMLNHHADLQSVKELLGHESLSTTEIYTHTSFEELKEMYNMAHPRAK